MPAAKRRGPLRNEDVQELRERQGNHGSAKGLMISDDIKCHRSHSP